MRIDAISIGLDPPRQVNVIIEVPVGGEPIKYEMDKEAGTLVVDRFLYTAMRYPGNYGFIPHTLSNDGDPCDVLVANTRAIVPGAVMSVRPVGVLMMEDEAGGDEKIIAVPASKLTQRYDKVKTYSDLPDITLQQIQHFFEHYKDLEPKKWVKVLRWGGAAPAQDLDPFFGFEILVVLEEVLDLLQRDVGQVAVGLHLVVALGQLRRRHRDDFLVAAGLVFHH